MPGIIVVLISLMIVGAFVAIETSNPLYSIISVGAVGFLLSIVFLFLAAPDLAITQIAVEVITLAILLCATFRSRKETVAEPRNWMGLLFVATMMLILATLGTRMFVEFPPFGEPVMERIADAPSNTYLRDGLEKTGAANIVSAVLLDFRAYDTLGEATVLFCAVLGALSILRHQARKRREDAGKEETEMDELANEEEAKEAEE